MSKYRWTFTLNAGDNYSKINPPVEWEELNIKINFESLGTANIEVDELTFTNEAFEIINDVVKNDNAFSEMALTIELETLSNGSFINLFQELFYLDLSTATFFNEFDTPKVKVKLKSYDKGTSIEDFLNGNTFLSIFSNGNGTTVVNQFFSDMFVRAGIIVEEEDTRLEEVILYVTIYNLSVQLANAIYNLGETIQNLIAHTTGGISGAVAGPAYLIGVGLLQIAQITAITIAMIELIKRLQEILLPIPFTRFAINIGLALQGIIKQFDGSDLEFSDNIRERIFNEYYLPSNLEGLDQSQQGRYVPNPSDYGYTYAEFLDMALKKYEAKLLNIDGKYLIANENDDILFINSTYELPNVSEKTYSLNLEEFNSRELYTYKIDLSDDYTVTNYRGTSYEIENNIEGNKNYNKLKDINYGVALGNRKNERNEVEELLEDVVAIVNAILFVFFAKPIKTPIIADRLGLVKVSNKSWSLPKILPLIETRSTYLGNTVYKLPVDHRDLISAKSNYERYHIKMEIEDPKNRRKVYEQVRVSFDYNSYKQLVNNNYFTLKGTDKKGKVVDITWNIDNDYAIIDYYLIDSYTIGNFTQIFTEI